MHHTNSQRNVTREQKTQMQRIHLLLLHTLTLGIAGWSQPAAINSQTVAQPQQRQPLPQAPAAQTGDTVRPNYILGPSDQITVRAFGVEELNDKAFRVGADGSVSMPLIGTVRAAGLTVQQLEAELTTR